jgi:hypothetical protein
MLVDMIELLKSAHGACTRTEAIGSLGRSRLRKALREGELVALWKGVVVHKACLADPRTRAAAAVLTLGPAAVLVNQTALWLHGLSAARPTPVHATVPYTRCPSPRRGIVIHQGRINPEDVLRRDALPVAALDVALADLLCTGPSRTALACLDQALQAAPTHLREEVRAGIAEQLEIRTDRRGTIRATKLLSLGDGRRESPAESSICLVVVDGGFPPPESQHCVHGIDGRELYRLDFAWPELRIALEYDGHAAHVDRKVQDAARDEDLRRRGWIVIRANADDLAHPAGLLGRLQAAFSLRLHVP